MDRNGREREARTKSVLVLKMLDRIIVWRFDGVDQSGRNWFLCVWNCVRICCCCVRCFVSFCFAFRSFQVLSGQFGLVCTVWNRNISLSHHGAYDVAVTPSCFVS